MSYFLDQGNMITDINKVFLWLVCFLVCICENTD